MSADYKPRPGDPQQPRVGRIVRVDSVLDRIATADARVEKLAEGFLFLEGPAWVRDGGYLLFGDPNANTI